MLSSTKFLILLKWFFSYIYQDFLKNHRPFLYGDLFNKCHAFKKLIVADGQMEIVFVLIWCKVNLCDPTSYRSKKVFTQKYFRYLVQTIT